MYDLNLKILAAQATIKAGVDKFGVENLYISFSGGKDSTVLLHMTRQMYPEMAAVFSDTTNELTEVLKFVNKQNNIIKIRPKIKFEDVLKEYGFPLVSKETSQKVSELKYTLGDKTRNLRLHGNEKGDSRLAIRWRYLADQKFDITQVCCQKLKKDPLSEYQKETGQAPIVGLMRGESRLRDQLGMFGGNEKKVYPFLNTEWTDEDIWAYAKKYNLRFAECYYDQEGKNGEVILARTRTGCEFCAFGITDAETYEARLGQSKKNAPKKFEKYMKIENNGVSFEDAIKVSLNWKGQPQEGYYGYKEGKEIEGIRTFTPNSVRPKCLHCGNGRTKKIKELRPLSKKIIGLNEEEVIFYVPRSRCLICNKISRGIMPGLKGNKYKI